MHRYLKDVFNISEEEAVLFASIFQLKEYKKGETFLNIGEVCNKVGFLEKGLVKCVFTANAKQVVDDFAFEKSFVANYHSFLTETPSMKKLVCMRDSSMRVATKNKIEELGAQHQFIERLARIISERLFISTHQKLEDIRLLSAQERYLKLLKSNKDLLQEIPQYEIASYLNVSPETVSRIRNNLAHAS